MLSIKFSDADEALSGVSSAVAAAEAHGCLCGALCASNEYTFAIWFDELSDNLEGATDALQSAKVLMQTLFKETMRALRGDEMEFTPLLPDDDAPLARRAEALAQWCQGFLYGFGTAAGQQRKLPPEADEIIRDLTQIAHASAGDTEPTDDDEEDYAEIVEYVRIGVQSLHDELRPTLQ
jgi:uncharacterized protein YgfB (UPF0149 family)